MNYIHFRQTWFDYACFNTNQIYAWRSNFDRNNLSRWLKKGLLVRLRQGFYTFPDYKHKPDFTYYFANQMYKPSYISLHSALSFYGVIPESVVQITSITPLKTALFKNEFGEYSFKTVKNSLIFGYNLKPIADGREIKFASVEKALLDLLYLYPFYNSKKEILELRLDEDFLHMDMNVELLKTYSAMFKSKSLESRVNILLEAYGL